MRLATIMIDDRATEAIVLGDGALPLEPIANGLDLVRGMAASGEAAPGPAIEWARAQAQRDRALLPFDSLVYLPAVPHPGAIYTVGLNYREPGEDAGSRPPRPLIYGKAASSVAAHGAELSWDRSLTDNVDAECELGVVIGAMATAVAPEDALSLVFGYTCINDISSRDPWLDGDQWLLGKSMPGFCPVGPWIVTRDDLDPTSLRLGCTINGARIQDGTTADMRFGVAEIIAFLSRHVTLLPGDLIATGTPARLMDPPGPERRLRPGDVVTVWIEGIGELTNTIA